MAVVPLPGADNTHHIAYWSQYSVKTFLARTASIGAGLVYGLGSDSSATDVDALRCLVKMRRARSPDLFRAGGVELYPLPEMLFFGRTHLHVAINLVGV
jgi:hypothetical protein